MRVSSAFSFYLLPIRQRTDPPVCILPFCWRTAYCLLVFLSSCKQKTDYTKEISRLDSAIAKLQEAEKIFISVDTILLRISYNSAEEKLHLISEKVAKDTINKNFGMLLSEVYEQAGNLRNFLDNKKFFERAMDEGQQRINDLKHDLKENLIEKNKSAEYIVNEINASEKICNTVNNTIKKAKSSAEKLDSLKIQITLFANSLKSK